MKTILLVAFGLCCWHQTSASDIEEICPTMKMICPMVTSDSGDAIQYIPKPIPSHQLTMPPLPTGMELPEGIQRFYCTKPACHSNPCLHASTCEETDIGFNCSCTDGYLGVTCEYDAFIHSASLLGGNSSEGRVAFTTRSSPSSVTLVHHDGWTSNSSQLVCRYLGFRGAYATVSGGYYMASSLDPHAQVGVIGCPVNATNITDCWFAIIRDDVKENSIGVVCCPVNSCGLPGIPLGVESGAIPDASITASSFYDVNLYPQYARLNGPSAWAALTSTVSQWLKVQFESNTVVTGIITQGRVAGAQFITSYTVSYSQDNTVWSDYTDDSGSIKMFSANYDPASSVINFLHQPIVGRYLRIHPKTYQNFMSLRLEIIGYGSLPGGMDQQDEGCTPIYGDRLGVENGRIPDSSLTSSSSFNGLHLPYDGRLNRVNVNGHAGAWVAANGDPDRWVKIDLAENYSVTGIITQGRYEYDQWVTSIFISYSTNNIDWTFALEGVCGGRKTFQANFDRQTHVTSLLPEPIVARYVRIHARTYYAYASMRYEVLGFAL